MSKGIVREYRFDDYCLRSRNSLWKKGAIIRFPPKELLFLSVLIENAGKIISKEQLMREVWKGGVVNDESLSRCAYSVRKLLSREANKKYIETIYGKGFVFSYPVFCNIAEENVNAEAAVESDIAIKSDVALLLHETGTSLDDRRTLQYGIEKILPDSVSLITAEIKDDMASLSSIMEAECCDIILRAKLVHDNLFSLRISTWNRRNEKFIDELIGLPGSQQLCHQLKQRMANIISEAAKAHLPAVIPLPSVDSITPHFHHCLHKEKCTSTIAEATVNIAVNYLDFLLENNMNGLRKTFYKVQELIEDALFMAPLDARSLAIMGLVRTIDKPDRWASHFLSQAMCIAPGNGTVNFYYAWHMLLKGDAKIALDALQLVEFSGEEKNRAISLKQYISKKQEIC